MEIGFPWIPLKSRSEVNYFCTCSIEIEKKNGEWLPRDLEVDTGAATTTLDMCDIYELGYLKKDCKKVYYRNANNEKIRAYRHSFKIKIGDGEIHDIPILFSARPIAIPVLGRAKILEKAKIVFNNEEKRTVFYL